MKTRVVLLAMALGLSACQAPVPEARTTNPLPVPKPAPTLSQAIARATDLGPANATVTVSLNFGLRGPAPDGLLVEKAVATLNASGMTAAWRAPSSLIAADGPAPAAAALLEVRIEAFRQADGSTFYAALDQPQLPNSIKAVATDVSGLDNYRRAHRYAVQPGGLTAGDVLSFYNLKPLRDAGLDGTGQTIVLPEIDDFNVSDLNGFGELAVEVSERPGDGRTRAAPGFRERVEKLRRARRRAVARDGDLLRRQDADAEASRLRDGALAGPIGAERHEDRRRISGHRSESGDRHPPRPVADPAGDEHDAACVCAHRIGELCA